MRAGDALDERRLAGAVVADERHHLAGLDLEVDVGQRLDRAERLAEVADLKKWRVAHGERPNGAVEAPRGRLHRCSLDAYLQYCLYVADAHVAPLQEPVREEALVVGLRDPDHRQRIGRLRMLAVRPGPVRLGLLALEERDRSICGSLRLGGHVLVDRARLPAGDDVLDTLDARVLPGERQRLEALRLQVGDDGAGDVVVRRQHALDVVARLDEHLVEDGRRVVRIPVGHELLRAPLDRLPLLKSGLKTAWLPAWNQNAFWSVWPPHSSATVPPL